MIDFRHSKTEDFRPEYWRGTIEELFSKLILDPDRLNIDNLCDVVEIETIHRVSEPCKKILKGYLIATKDRSAILAIPHEGTSTTLHLVYDIKEIVFYTRINKK